MIFNSYAFLLGFLPLAWITYVAAARDERLRLLVLFVISLVFYGWWNPLHVPLLLASILLNWLAALAFARSGRRAIIVAAIVLNLGVLALFKYLVFFNQVAADVAGHAFDIPALALPLGISFFTFHHIMYLADLGAGKTSTFPLTHYALYIGFFPQVLSGPLVRYNEVMHQWARPPFGEGAAERIGRGLIFIVLGLVEKVLLGDPVASVVNPIYARAVELAGSGASLGLAEAWTAAFGFGLQIYFDFAGYSHIAVGVALLFGIMLPQNFNAPYRAASIREFWRRWHMTLSRFLRDYLYIPLGGNRHGLALQILALIVTMTLAGLWHGAGWPFVVWGLLHGIALSADVLWRRAGFAMPTVLGWVLTLLFVMLAWPLFRAPTFAAALPIFHGLTSFSAPGALPNLAPLAFGGAVALLAPTTWSLATRLRPSPLLGAILAVLLLVVLVRIGDGENYEFIYFRF
jgi:D-alanyl-lipoteichoic acid acyltransferase DltB (MBOAT superfamily)